MFVNFLSRYSSQLYALLSVEWLTKFEDIAQSLLKRMSLWCLLCAPHPTTHQTNTSARLRKVYNQITPAYHIN